jgi:integrase
VLRWVNEQQHRKRPEDDAQQLRFLDPYLKNKHLDEINKALIDKIKTEKLKTGVKNATVNRMLTFLRALLNKAHREWDWLESAPPIKMLPDTAKRTRWLTKEEAQSLLNELPEHLSSMAAFTLATGLRESNVTGLKWAQLDMQRAIAWIHPEQAKSGKAIGVPLNSDALRIIRAQIGKHLTHVFSYKGKPVTRANNHAWRKALVRAGINDFRWHDLRHTWASWHMQAGTPIHILKELGGWADLSMVMRYAHLSAEHIAGYADNVGSNLCDKSTTPTQNTKTKAA